MLSRKECIECRCKVSDLSLHTGALYSEEEELEMQIADGGEEEAFTAL